MVVATDEFVDLVIAELEQMGFSGIRSASGAGASKVSHDVSIAIEHIAPGFPPSGIPADIPIIFAFDFIDGAGAVVLFPDDDREFLQGHSVRIRVAEYMSGYCAFWNIGGCDWLHDALPAIKDNETSEAAQRTAAHMCARIAANIAVGREVKRYPRFYIAESGE